MFKSRRSLTMTNTRPRLFKHHSQNYVGTHTHKRFLYILVPQPGAPSGTVLQREYAQRRV